MTNAASFSAFFELWIELEGGAEAASVVLLKVVRCRYQFTC